MVYFFRSAPTVSCLIGLCLCTMKSTTIEIKDESTIKIGRATCRGRGDILETRGIRNYEHIFLPVGADLFMSKPSCQRVECHKEGRIWYCRCRKKLCSSWFISSGRRRQFLV